MFEHLASGTGTCRCSGRRRELGAELGDGGRARQPGAAAGAVDSTSRTRSACREMPSFV